MLVGSLPAKLAMSSRLPQYEIVMNSVSFSRSSRNVWTPSALSISGLMPASELYVSYSSARSGLVRPRQIRAMVGVFGLMLPINIAPSGLSDQARFELPQLGQDRCTEFHPGTVLRPRGRVRRMQLRAGLHLIDVLADGRAFEQGAEGKGDALLALRSARLRPWAPASSPQWASAGRRSCCCTATPQTHLTRHKIASCSRFRHRVSD